MLQRDLQAVITLQININKIINNNHFKQPMKIPALQKYVDNFLEIIQWP